MIFTLQSGTANYQWSWNKLATNSSGLEFVTSRTGNSETNVYSSIEGVHGATGSWEGVASDSTGDKLIACESISGLTHVGIVQTSIDGGNSWTTRTPSGADRIWRDADISDDGSTLIVCAESSGGVGGRIWISTDGGVNWTETQPTGNVDRVWNRVTLNSDGTKILAAVRGGKVYRSTNGGANWSEITPTGSSENKNWSVLELSSDGNFVMAGIYAGRVYISTDGGDNFNETQPAGNVTKSWNYGTCDADGSHLGLISEGQYYAYISSNQGVSWDAVQPATPDTTAGWYSIATNSDGSVYYFGGQLSTQYSTIYRGTQVVTKIKKIAELVKGSIGTLRGVAIADVGTIQGLE